MSKEKLGFNLEGLELSPNKEANDVENYLGITYPNTKPAKILLTPQNKIRLLKNRRLMEDFNMSLANFIPNPLASFKDLGFYTPEYNSIVLIKNGYEEALHENIHGLIHQLNPGIMNYKRFSARKVLGNTYDDNRTLAFNAAQIEKLEKKGNIIIKANEKLIAFNFFEEGLAQFGTNEVINRLDGVVKTFDSLKLHRERLVRMHDDTKFGRKDSRPKGYLLAYEWYLRAMTNLVYSKGMRLSEVIKLSIKNPPNSSKDLTKPLDYCLKLCKNL